MISDLAYVHPDARLGRDVTVEPFAFIEGDVEIGDRCWIGTGAVIRNGARMGCECRVHTGAVVSGIPQDLKFDGEYSTVEMGDRNTVRECATINRGTRAKGRTLIGDDNLIMSYAHIAHDCTIGNHCVIVSSVLLAGEVEVGDWAVIGGNAAVHQFTRIGAHAMIGGGALVGKDVPPFVLAGRYPVTYQGANVIGLRRRGFTSEQITAIQGIFRVLFQSGHSYNKGVDMVLEQFPPSPERDAVVEFIRSSKRGILKPFNPFAEQDD